MAFTSAPLEQAALTFLPRARARWEAAGTVQLLFVLGLADGLLGGALCAALPLAAPQLLTRDAAVWPLMAQIAPQAGAAMLLIGLDISANGVLLARRDYGYIARSYAITLASLAAFLAWSRGSLAGVWWSIVFFFGARTAQSLLRLATRRSEPLPPPIALAASE